ncbi:DUF2497 domain-containing protein [Amphiplicatus metriothermophilus]|uniref:DUF2497 domain-containing protein n=1 Tax=Amphiplicatus metriothermophilus TaxID=1519374 RepID=A0A239PXN7_9PROT|nr:DUF2497 domain-containing protein [Amphiplicatus metriothermophilus]MBB5519890.1 hypothetical protein [Amphiplicatus metriothermophilus]SNT74793.1 hypothetical protein SAMN06297382_2379 [Amphiplicatus metriothermophilus]
MTTPQPEPSMEEILASIRRIISEDDDSAGDEARPQAAQAKPSGEPAAPKPSFVGDAAPTARPRPAETAPPAAPAEPVRRPAAPDLHQSAASRPAGGPERSQPKEADMKSDSAAMTMRDDDGEESFIDETTAAAASRAFQALSQNVRVSAGDGRTLEDIVVEMLRPMVKDWLDANLPAIVEEKVEEEVKRLARRRL